MPAKTIKLEEWRAEQTADPEFRAALEELEPAYQVIRMRALRGLTQAELAQRVGTTQSSIARLESGTRQPSLSFLRRVARALDALVVVRLEPDADAAPERPQAVDLDDRTCSDTQREAHILIADWPTSPGPAPLSPQVTSSDSTSKRVEWAREAA